MNARKKGRNKSCCDFEYILCSFGQLCSLIFYTCKLKQIYLFPWLKRENRRQSEAQIKPLPFTKKRTFVSWETLNSPVSAQNVIYTLSFKCFQITGPNKTLYISKTQIELNWLKNRIHVLCAEWRNHIIFHTSVIFFTWLYGILLYLPKKNYKKIHISGQFCNMQNNIDITSNYFYWYYKSIFQ